MTATEEEVKANVMHGKDGRFIGIRPPRYVGFERGKRRYQDHPDELRRVQTTWRKRIRAAALQNYSGNPPFCSCCGERGEVFLTIDHVNGGGKQHLREQKIWSGTGLYSWLRKTGYPTGFQVLCYNCNMAKGKLGRCPHVG